MYPVEEDWHLGCDTSICQKEVKTMSGMDNHRKRSRRSWGRKRAAFGNMTRRILVRQSVPRRRIKLPTLRDLFRILKDAVKK